MAFEAQQFDLEEILLGAKYETTYGQGAGVTAGFLSEASFFHRLRSDGSAFAQILPKFRSDHGRAGKGHPFTTERQRISNDSALALNQEVSDFFAGWMLAFIMNHEVLTGAGPYTHTFTFENATNQAKVTSVFCKTTADVLFKLQDLYGVSLDVSGGPNGPLMAKMSLVGSGRWTDGDLAAGASTIALPTNVYLLGSDTDVLIGNVGAAVSVKERINSWNIKIDSQCVVHRGSGGGLPATMTKLGMPKVQLQIEIAAKDVDDIRTRINNDTLSEVQINTTSGAAQLNFTFKGVYLKGQNKLQGNDVMYQIDCSSDEDIIKNGANEVLTAVAINTQSTAYLTPG